MIKLKPIRQTSGLCGPASLKMVFDYYGVSVSEAEIALAARASKAKGTSLEGLVKTAQFFGFKTYIKKNSSLNDLRHFIDKGVPVIVDWFLEDDGHYSVAVAMDKESIVLMDPSLKGQRKIPLKKFFRIWFDFPGDYIKDSKEVVLRVMLAVVPKLK